jgi:hypothetical protein
MDQAISLPSVSTAIRAGTEILPARSGILRLMPLSVLPSQPSMACGT